MLTWQLIQGRLADGFPMRMYLAANAGKLWSASMHDDEHPLTEDAFVARLSHQANGLPTTAVDGTGSDVLFAAAEQVVEYFAGKRLTFKLPLSFKGTPFQVRVWHELMEIPFGAIRTYGEVAQRIGNPAAFRAVGSANGRNNLPVFIPCHRVLAAGGKLGGFTGGIGLKKRLLGHEASVLSAHQRA